MSRGHAGHINVGVGPNANDEFLLAAVTELLRTEPRITMKVIVSDQDELIPALRRGEIDLVINLVYPKPPAGLAYIHLREDECVVSCGQNHRLAGRTHVALAELSDERWALGEPGLPTQQILHQIFRDHGLEPPRATLQTRLLSMRLRAAVSSDLLLYGSKAIAQQFGSLHVLPVEELRWVRSVGVLHRKEPYLSPAIRRFIDILKKATPGSAARALRAS